MTSDHGENGWQEWSNHVLAELRRQNEWLASIQRTMNDINVEIAVLKVKAGVWGATGGLLVALTALLLGWLTKR